MAESNRTEKATPKKRRDERKKGNAYQSKDLVSVIMIIVGFLLTTKFASFIAKQVGVVYANQMDRMVALNTLTESEVMRILWEATIAFFLTGAPIIMILAIVAFIATGAQTQFLFSSDLLKFKYSRISFLQGVKRMFSLRSVVQLVKSIIKIVVITAIIFSGMKGLLIVVPDTINTGMGENLLFMKNKIMSMVYQVCLIFAGVAILDFGYQKYEYEKKLRMTKQEIKDEYKQTEGDPFIKGRIREKQRKMSMNRMIQQIPFADVVVRNPTHYAVALKYDLEKDPAPIVLAKGKDHMALRIIKEAEKKGVLVTENRPLAKSLYESTELNAYISVEFYQVVAEVMAWVFKTRQKQQGTPF